MNKSKDKFEQLLMDSFYAAIDAADPHKVVPPHVPVGFEGDVVVSAQAKLLPVWRLPLRKHGLKKI